MTALSKMASSSEVTTCKSPWLNISPCNVLQGFELQKKISIAGEEKKHAYHELLNLQENLQEVGASLKVIRMELAHVCLCWSILQKPRKEGKSFKEEKRSISLNLQEWAVGVIWMYKNLDLPFLIWVFSHCTIIASCELTCFWVEVTHFAAFFCWC